jgi:proteasome assembly chaperone (PAC2) family protein
LDKKFNNFDDKFSKKRDWGYWWLGGSQTEILEIKRPINQIKISMKSINNKLDPAEEIITRIEDMVEELLYSDRNKRKN